MCIRYRYEDMRDYEGMAWMWRDHDDYKILRVKSRYIKILRV